MARMLGLSMRGNQNGGCRAGSLHHFPADVATGVISNPSRRRPRAEIPGYLISLHDDRHVDKATSGYMGRQAVQLSGSRINSVHRIPDIRIGVVVSASDQHFAGWQ